MPTPPPAAPTFTEVARRAQIVQAAITTVGELGYHRASLSEIARRAAVAKSAIVYYFASKDALMLHVVDHVFARIDESVENAVAAHAEPGARLRAYLEAYLAHVDAHRAEVVAGVDIAVSHRGPDGVPLYLTGTDEDSALLRGILVDAMEQGSVRRMPVAVAVDIVEAALDVTVTALQRDPAADLGILSAEIVTAVVRGLAPDAG